MQTRVQKWGKSLALRIPKTLAEEAGIGVNSPVELSTEEGRLVVAREAPRRYTLKGLLAKVTARNRHGEIHTGPCSPTR